MCNTKHIVPLLLYVIGDIRYWIRYLQLEILQ